MTERPFDGSPNFRYGTSIESLTATVQSLLVSLICLHYCAKDDPQQANEVAKNANVDALLQRLSKIKIDPQQLDAARVDELNHSARSLEDLVHRLTRPPKKTPVQ